jgi:molecular chaperone GrpE (heat shock protein)
MPTYRITITATSLPSVRAKLKKADIDGTVEKVEVPTSRAARLSEAESSVDEARSVCEELKDEMEQWRDSLPENLQSGDKAQQIEDCISQLEDIISNLESADFSSVDFPGMYG